MIAPQLLEPLTSAPDDYEGLYRMPSIFSARQPATSCEAARSADAMQRVSPGLGHYGFEGNAAQDQDTDKVRELDTVVHTPWNLRLMALLGVSSSFAATRAL